MEFALLNLYPCFHTLVSLEIQSLIFVFASLAAVEIIFLTRTQILRKPDVLMGLRCSAKGVTILSKLSNFPSFLSSHFLHVDCCVLKGIFKRQRVLQETKFTSAVLVPQRATANGRNSVPAGPLQTPWPPHILPGA